MVGQSRRLREPVAARTRRLLLLAGVAILAAVAAVVVYASLHGDPYATSAHGCVNVQVASSTGGSTLLHECGAAASRWCRLEATRPDALAVLTLPQCRLAGDLPARP